MNGEQMNTWRRVTMLLVAYGAALAAAGCVTINIYFPAAAAEKAADKIIEEVYQLKKSTEPAKPAPTDKK